MLFEHVQDYLHVGSGALGEYSDEGYRLRVAEEFQSILQPAPYIYEYPAVFSRSVSRRGAMVAFVRTALPSRIY
jgi:hypothetical protein